ncbi:MAG: hypothetical protein WDM81_11170 [Rhizomicrobium sp.]
MSLEHLKSRLPDYAKDLKLNLSSLAAESVLTEQQKAGTFIVSALAARNAETTAAILAEFGPKLAPEALAAAQASAAIMAMNNIYYRFTHLASAPDYKTLPARLRMNAMAKPALKRPISNCGRWRCRRSMAAACASTAMRKSCASTV